MGRPCPANAADKGSVVEREFRFPSSTSVPYDPTSVMALEPIQPGSVFAVAPSHQPQHDGGSGSSTTGSSAAAPASDGPAAGQGQPQQHPDQQPTPSDDPVTTVSATAPGALSALQKATSYCQQNLTSSQLDALGGLTDRADAYLEEGAGRSPTCSAPSVSVSAACSEASSPGCRDPGLRRTWMTRQSQRVESGARGIDFAMAA